MSLRVDAYIREGDGVTHRISNAKDGDWIGVVITINNTTEFDITAFDTAAAGKLAGIFEHAAIEFRNFVARKGVPLGAEGSLVRKAETLWNQLSEHQQVTLRAKHTP